MGKIRHDFGFPGKFKSRIFATFSFIKPLQPFLTTLDNLLRMVLFMLRMTGF